MGYKEIEMSSHLHGYCNRLKILNLNLSVNYSEFSIQISNPLVIHLNASLIPKPFPIF